MDHLNYSQQKELVEEILATDNNFLSLHNLELNIFKYTSLFAVFTFTFQIIILVIQNFYGLFYLSYGQFLLLVSGLIGITILLELYLGLTSAIRRSLHSKGIHLKRYCCERCDFNSFSSMFSSVHMVTNPAHSLEVQLILVKYSRMNFSLIGLESLVNPTQKRLREFNDPDLTIYSESDWRIRKEMSDGIRSLSGLVFSIFFPIAVISIFIGLDYFILKSLVLAIYVVTLIFGSFMIVNWVIAYALANGEEDSVHLLKVKLKSSDKPSKKQIRLKLFKVGREYWEHVKKGADIESIDTEMGPLYLIDKIVLNRFGELTEILPTRPVSN